MKTCRICNRTKPADAYRGTRSACRECGCAYGAEWGRALRLADDAAESVICTEGHSPRERQWVHIKAKSMHGSTLVASKAERMKV